jgi:hypothetical protein
MRKRRVEAKTRIAVKAFLAGNAGAAETCLAISHGTYHDSTLLSEEDIKLLKAVGSETDDLPVGKLQDNLCMRLLDAMKARKAEAEK